MIKIKVRRKGFFWTGITILILLALSFFIKIKVDEGFNFLTLDSLLGIIIFHNPFVLGIYILIIISLIAKGFSKIK